METVLEVQDIVTRFGTDVVHDGVGFAVRRGEVVALIGGSGTGKSVLLKEMIGLLRPTAGRVHLFGTDVWQSDEDAVDGLRRRFGMLFQDGALFSSLSVAENIAVPLREHHRAARCADRAPGRIQAVAGRPVAGNRPKGAVRALWRDEKARGAGPGTRPRTRDPVPRRADLRPRPDRRACLRQPGAGLSDSLGLTVFMVTHDLDTLLSIIDRTIALSKGKVIADGPVADVMRSAHPWIREYFSSRAPHEEGSR